VGGEDQLKALVRQGFALQNTADKSVLTVDGVLAQTMGNVKRLVESLPQEGLLRNKAWRDLEPLVKEELDKYGRQLGKTLVNSNSQAAPDMRDYAVREFDNGGADLPEAVRVRNQPVPGSVEMALRSQVNNMTLDKMFNVSGKAKGEAPILKALFKTVDTRVRGGIIRGDTTKAIADLMATDVITSGIPGVKLTAPVAKQIQSQAMTIARTATQDMARQVKEQLYEQNKAATEGMVWQWSTALDSRTCETCAPLDARRWPQDGQTSPPTWPIHPNCRCQSLLIDPEDPFWNGDEVTAQQIRPAEKGAYADGYKTPITINGEKFYRKAITVTSDTGRPRYSDVLAKWATDSSTSLDEALGPGRARWFKAQYQKMNADPQKILQAMLTQKPAGQQTFISLDALQKKSLDFKPKAKPALPKPKPKPKPKAEPKPAVSVKPPKAALKTYTGRNFDSVRAQEFRAAQEQGKKLSRYEESQVRKFGINPKHKKQADEIETFLNQAPKYEGTVQRGLNMPRKDLDDLLAGYKSGGESLAMESWTKGKVLNDFTAGADQHVILRAKNKRGVDITEYSEFAKEEEVLIPTGARYSLKGVQKEEISPGLSKKGIYRWIIDLDQK
tara:strand:+ start:4256 stop:6097 length:1842 start_codon:yes stop_codon:yes gene_type:complete